MCKLELDRKIKVFGRKNLVFYTKKSQTWCNSTNQNHYREVPWREVFIEHELRFALDLGRLVVLKKNSLGRLWATFEGVFFMFSGAKIFDLKKNCSVCTKKLHHKKENLFLSFFEKNNIDWIKCKLFKSQTKWTGLLLENEKVVIKTS